MIEMGPPRWLTEERGLLLNLRSAVSRTPVVEGENHPLRAVL